MNMRKQSDYNPVENTVIYHGSITELETATAQHPDMVVLSTASPCEGVHLETGLNFVHYIAPAMPKLTAKAFSTWQKNVRETLDQNSRVSLLESSDGVREIYVKPGSMRFLEDHVDGEVRHVVHVLPSEAFGKAWIHEGSQIGILPASEKDDGYTSAELQNIEQILTGGAR